MTRGFLMPQTEAGPTLWASLFPETLEVKVRKMKMKQQPVVTFVRQPSENQPAGEVPSSQPRNQPAGCSRNSSI